MTTQPDAASPTMPLNFSVWLDRHRVSSAAADLADLTGLDRAKRAISSIAYGLLHPSEIEAAGGELPAAILLAGPVGCGKTSLARCLAGMVANKAIFIEAVASELTPGIVSEIVAFADASGDPVVVFVDELSWLGVDRSSRFHDPNSRAALFAVLSAISGLRDSSRQRLLWIGATSDDPATLDEALTRSGRFSRVITVRNPGPATRLAHLERRLRERRPVGGFDLGRLVGLTAGKSFADLDQAVDDALAAAMADGGPAAGIDQAHLEEAISAEGRTDDEPDDDPADRWRIAVHEAAHALVAEVLDPGSVTSISVLGHRGGATLMEAEGTRSRTLLTDGAILRRITILLAGAEGERLVFPDEGPSTGSAHDASAVASLISERHAAGIDPDWGASWPSWLDVGPVRANKRVASYEALRRTLQDRANAIVREHAPGLAHLARRLAAAGDLAGNELAIAITEAKACAHVPEDDAGHAAIA